MNVIDLFLLGHVLGTTILVGGAFTLQILAVLASGNDGNLPANTIDDQLGTRWSASGSFRRTAAVAAPMEPRSLPRSSSGTL